MSSALDQEAQMALRGVRSRMNAARLFAWAALVAFVAGFFYYLTIVWRASQSAGSSLALWGFLDGAMLAFLVFCPFFVVGYMTARRTNDMYGAAKNGEVPFLRKLNSAGWGVASLLLSNPVTGVLLLATRGRISRLRIPVDPPYDSGPLMSVQHMTKYFDIRRTMAQSMRGASGGKVHAVDDVSFDIQRAEVFGLAGESGSGKTTVLRTALALTPISSGSIIFRGKDLSKMSKGELANYRRKVQVIFQDPYESVNPRMTVFEIVAEGLAVNNLTSSREEEVERVTKALRDVQLTPAEEYMYRYPHELSGGQRQRVAVARALVLDPELILADEPVSMLDVSIRAEVISALLSVRENRGISIVIVTHDLALSKDIVDELAIMYVGKLVESGPAQEVVSAPYHPYTRALTAAVPVPDPEAEKVRVLARGEIPTNVSPPSGCRFHPRCVFAQAVCAEKEPPFDEVAPGRRVACHFWKEAHEAFAKGLDAPVGSVAQA